MNQPPDQSYLNLLEDVPVNPIFILGDHRSGTTLLYKTLVETGCFNAVRAYHVINYDEILSNYVLQREAAAIGTLKQRFETLGICDRKIDNVPATPTLPEEYGFILKNSEGEQSCITTETLSIFQQLCQKIQYISDPNKPLLLKNSWDYGQFLQVQQLLPNARFIFIHRYPVHIINSKLKAARTILSRRSNYMALLSKEYTEIFKRPIKRALLRFLYANYFDSGVRQVTDPTVKSATYFLDHIDTLPAQNYHSLKYEALCKSPEITIQNILSFLNLTAENKLNYEQLISPRKVDLLPEVKKQRDVICQQLRPYLVYHAGL
ncbi:MAG: sulfotransferase [Cyanobacteria bacterium J06621_11]